MANEQQVFIGCCFTISAEKWSHKMTVVLHAKNAYFIIKKNISSFFFLAAHVS